MDSEDILSLIDELRISDDAQRRHVESIHILITTVILASYFTPTAQIIIATQELEFYTNILIVTAVGYLSIRLIDVTVPIRRINGYVDFLFGFIAPLGFLFTLLGYIALILVSVLDVQVSMMTAIAVGIVLVGSSLVLAYLHIKYQDREREEVESRLKQALNHIKLYKQYVYEKPNLVEEGLEWESRNVVRAGATVDLIGRDCDGRPVIAELKIGDIGKSRVNSMVRRKNRILEKENHPEETRFMLIHDSKIKPEVKNLLEEESIECIEFNISY